jgi:hypothetical protein
MTDRELQRWSDARLVDALRGIGSEIDWPVVTATDGGAGDLAATVRRRIDALPISDRPGATGWRARRSSPVARPARRAFLLAAALLTLLLALAAIAGAAGVGLPGLRVLFGNGAATPPPSATPLRSAPPGEPGAGLRLGDPVSPADPAALDAEAGFHVRWPADPRIGQPDAAYVDDSRHGQVSLVWSTRADLPATLDPSVGLLLTEFVGSVNETLYEKLVGSGTTVEAVLVGGHRGYWLSGGPHFFFYTGPSGLIQDDRRWVGDALIWSDGGLTYRLESALGRDPTISIAETLR